MIEQSDKKCFPDLRTFVEKGIEYTRFKGRAYRVYRRNIPAHRKDAAYLCMYLLPMVSVDEEVAKDKYRQLLKRPQ